MKRAYMQKVQSARTRAPPMPHALVSLRRLPFQSSCRVSVAQGLEHQGLAQRRRLQLVPGAFKTATRQPLANDVLDLQRHRRRRERLRDYHPTCLQPVYLQPVSRLRTSCFVAHVVHDCVSATSHKVKDTHVCVSTARAFRTSVESFRPRFYSFSPL